MRYITIFVAHTSLIDFLPISPHPFMQPLNMTFNPFADSLKVNTAINTKAFRAIIPLSCQTVGMRAPLSFMLECIEKACFKSLFTLTVKLDG